MTVSNETRPKAKPIWNPFQPLLTEQDAITAGRSAAAVSGYIALSYLVQIGLLHLAGRDSFGHAGPGAMMGDAFALLLAGFLTWRILARQPLWAAVMVTAWFTVESAAKVLAIAAGTQRLSPAFVLMFLALVATLILGLRGSWRLRQPASPEPVFG